jgi:hypothetical protein
MSYTLFELGGGPLTAPDGVELVVCSPDAVGVRGPGLAAGRKRESGGNDGGRETHVGWMLGRAWERIVWL